MVLLDPSTLEQACSVQRDERPLRVCGIRDFVSKMTLAFAAVLVLPLLEWFGYQPGLTNAQKGLTALSAGYALLPCLLKILAIVALVRLPMQGHRK
mgnify:CR=1 FL=1